jgi:hypothetical protein
MSASPFLSEPPGGRRQARRASETQHKSIRRYCVITPMGCVAVIVIILGLGLAAASLKRGAKVLLALASVITAVTGLVTVLLTYGK